MGRLVRSFNQPAASGLSIPGLEGVLGGAVAQPPARPDNYLERMAKYVPAEVLAFSLFVNCILVQAARNGGASANMAGIPIASIALGAFLAGMIATPLYVWYVRGDGDAWITNAVVSTAVYPFWAYAIGAVAFERIHDGNLAAIMLATVTLCSGMVSPPQRERRQKKSPNERPQLVEVSGNQLTA